MRRRVITLDVVEAWGIMGRAIGIDLGTTNSCAAYIKDGRPCMVTFSNGSKSVPSVFAIDKEGNRLVGEEAAAQAAANPMGTVNAAKRLLGQSFESEAVDQMQQVFTYEMVEGANSEVMVKVAEQVLTLEQVSAAILRRVREEAEDALDEDIDMAVITVPAYFNDKQRQAVRAAGKLAGLNVLRVLNEPTAAALSYGLGRSLQQRIAVYDLGGGTFDISVIQIRDKVFEVVATGGDTFLGGVDFDDRLMQFVLQSFADESGIDVSYDRTAVRRIRDASETAKIELSDEMSTTIHLAKIGKDDDDKWLDLKITVTREQLEALTKDLVERSISTCRRILAEISKDRNIPLDDVLMVGGQSRMPLVRRSLAKFLGRKPRARVDPHEAVALGAAIMAHSLAASMPDDAKITLLDVLPMPIGIARPDHSMHTLFHKNQPLPETKSRTLTTNQDNQSSIILRLYQGESDDARKNVSLGTFVFSGLPAAPKGDVKVKVTFHVDSEGMLNLSAIEEGTGKQVESRVKIGERRKKRDTEPKRRRKADIEAEEEAKKKTPAKKRKASRKGRPKKRRRSSSASYKARAAKKNATGASTSNASNGKGAADVKSSAAAKKKRTKKKAPASAAQAVPRPEPKAPKQSWFKRNIGRWFGGSE